MASFVHDNENKNAVANSHFIMSGDIDSLQDHTLSSTKANHSNINHSVFTSVVKCHNNTIENQHTNGGDCSAVSTTSMQTVELTPVPFGKYDASTNTCTNIACSDDDSTLINDTNKISSCDDRFIRTIFSPNVTETSLLSARDDSIDDYSSSHNMSSNSIANAASDVNISTNNPQQEQEEQATEGAIDEDELTEEERIQRDIEMSERLAWEMMRQESLETYELQMQYMRENAESMSQEDLAAIQLIVNEATAAINNPNNVANGDGDDGEEGEENGNESDASDPDNWDYDRLLQLGNTIGDVKTERWKIRAPKVIESLLKVSYESILHRQKKEQETDNSHNDSSSSSSSSSSSVNISIDETHMIKKVRVDPRCAVCMDCFDISDIDLTLLNCGHYFHSVCASGWISGANSCPMCKSKIMESPV